VISAETATDAAPARKTRWHALGVFLAALSLLIQAFVVQPHIDGVAYAGVNAAGLHQLTNATSPEKAPGACIICQEAALAGAFALAATPVLFLIERNFIATASAPALRTTPRRASHIWQSRAPPQAI
jgi:hypothetical protein